MFDVVTDNLSVNEKAFKSLQKTYAPRSICSVEHPINNAFCSAFHTIFDTTHLMKNIRNNWVSEKPGHLNF